MAEQKATIDEVRRDVHDWNATRSNGKHKSSKEIESEIDDTRYAMDRTMNEISERFHPGTMVDHAFDYITKKENREKIGNYAKETGESLAETFRRNPGPLLLIGGGIAWLLTGERKEKQQVHHYYAPYGSEVDARTGRSYPTERETGGSLDSSEGGDGFGEKAKGTAQKAGEKAAGAVRGKAEQALNSAKGAAGTAGSSLRQSGYQAGESISHGASSAGRRSQHQLAEGARRAGNTARENPIAVGLGALALGILAGGLVPGSKAEDRLAGPQSEEAKRRLSETAETAREKVAATARKTAEAASESAEEQGIHPEQLSEETPYVAEEPASKNEEPSQR